MTAQFDSVSYWKLQVCFTGVIRVYVSHAILTLPRITTLHFLNLPN